MAVTRKAGGYYLTELTLERRLVNPSVEGNIAAYESFRGNAKWTLLIFLVTFLHSDEVARGAPVHARALLGIDSDGAAARA